MVSDVDKVKTMLKKKQLSTSKIKKKDLLSSGSTLLNLACTGKWQGAFYKGGYFLIVGDSDSGKTFLSMTCLAEASINPLFDDYTFYHDNPEGGALMNIAHYFGKNTAIRLKEPPRGTSEHLEDFYFNLDTALAAGPCIYILDSMDVLDTRADSKKFKEKKTAADKNKEESGSYGTAKAKQNSEGLRRVTGELKKNGSILIVITQTRDNIGFGAQFNPKTRAGGRALKFYARLELWSAVKGELKKSVRGKTRQLGIISQIKVKKNHVTGQKRTVEIPIYHSSGIDDIGACVDFLIEEKHWKKGSNGIAADDLIGDKRMDRERLIAHIEDMGIEDDVRQIVADVWHEIEEASKIKRKKRYE